jgi:restriction endonuclease Mrr
MPVPEFNEIKAPALQFFAADGGKAHKISEVYGVLASHFNLTMEEQSKLLPSGNQI